MRRAFLASCVVLLVAAILPAADKLSVDEALRQMGDPAHMQRIRGDRARLQALYDAFRDLPEAQRPAVVKKLVPLLSTVQGGAARRALIEAFRALGDPSVPALVRALEDDAAWRNAAGVLPYLREKAVRPLLTLLTHRDAEMRRRAAQVLGGVCGPPGRLANRRDQRDPVRAAATALGAALKDESLPVALAAAQALAGMRSHAAPATGALTSALSAGEFRRRLAAAKALKAVGPAASAAAPALEKALGDADADVRLQAIESLAAVAGEKAVGPLTGALSHPDKRVRVKAAFTLARLGEGAVPGLAKALASRQPTRRRFAALALAKMGPKAASAVPALLAALKDPREAVRCNVVDALGRIGGEGTAQAVAGRLGDDSVLVRHCALVALDLLGKDLPQAQAVRKQMAGAAKPTRFEAPPYAYPAKEFLVGGPLEGVPLPLYPTQHGEPPGHPGCVPALQKPDEKGNVPFTPEGVQPERHLYPGAVEHYRTYWQKYNPLRFFFDRQSQIKNWLAGAIRGVRREQVEEYAEPLYWVPRFRLPRPTGLKNKPVPVVRCKAGDPVMELDLGTLPIGLYAVRVIGAVPTEQLRRYRLPLRMAFSVNDGPNGAVSTYKLRLGYCDEFYSVAEFYFHAPAKRTYRAKLWVLPGSRVDLLVHNVTLDDALAGIELRPVKKRMTLTSAAERAALRLKKIADLERRMRGRKYVPPAPRPLEEQWARDEVLWHLWPGLNAQPGALFGANRGYQPDLVFGVGGKPGPNAPAAQDEPAARWGRWTHPWPRYGFRTNASLAALSAGLDLLVNAELGLRYTTADLAAKRPLPDPYPYKDDGTGLYFEPKEGKPQYFNVVADAVSARVRAVAGQLGRLATAYHEMGDVRAGRDAALLLIRIAYDTPAIDGANALSSLLADPGPWGRDLRCRRRLTVAHWGVDPVLYDRLFDVIQGNEELARSVRRFIPWVRSSADVVALLDGYLVQNDAKRILRYNKMWDNAPTLIVTPAMILGDTAFTKPWMEWLWSKAYIYPNPPSGLPDLITTANGGDGAGYIASWFYCQGEEASKNGDALARYIALGGDPKYDLRNPRLYPKVTAACYWPIRTLMAGLYFPRIGDVCGPDKYWGHTFNTLGPKMRRGWRWTHDPVFAWMIVNHFGRKGESDAEWAAITRAAATLKRAPYLTQPSRIVSNWFGLLETGRQYDDPRFRRNVLLRTGHGWGHHHHDTLDLQIHAHGYPMTVDGGQRPGYSKPADRGTRQHNLVVVNGKEWMGHAWIKALSDAEGARYMLAEATPTANHPEVKLYRRQVALLDVDEGKGARPWRPGNPFAGSFPSAGVVTPNSYVLDVVRVSGGKQHTYAFHATLDDELKTNVPNPQPYDKLPQVEQEYLAGHRYRPEIRTGGDAPDTVVATWRMTRQSKGFTEQQVNRLIWDPNSPRKYTRLHLLGQRGARVLTGWFYCRQWDYGWRQLYVQHRAGADRDIVFPALIEPYVGEPFIVERRLLPVADNDADALRAVAVEVRTKNGHVDLCFADGRPDKTRRVAAPQGEVAVAGEFAYLSSDAQGLRQAALTGGTLLRSPLVTLKAAAREYTGRVIKADYPERTFFVDRPWPAFRGGERVLEIGKGAHWTAYTAVRVAPQGRTRAAVTLRNGASLYASRVVEVDERARTVYCALALPFVDSGGNSPLPGEDRDLVASNRERTKFWRAQYLGGDRSTGKFGFRLDGEVSLADFGPSRSFRLWEYGVGDTARHSTFVSLRRVGDNQYELTADVDVEVAFGKGAARRIPLAEITRNGGRLVLKP